MFVFRSLACLVLTVALGACGNSVSAPKTPASPEVSARVELSARQIVERYKPAIVRVENKMGGGAKVGTGFIVSEEGRVATNLHVIAGGGVLTVKLSDGTSHLVERVVAVDPKRDLAIIEFPAGKKLPTVPLGDSDKVVPGDVVIAIGNPMQLDFTVSDGLISSVRPFNEGVILQISAPISQGSSGGPLFNSFGEVIGVATLVMNAGQNLNFGVPINYLQPLLKETGGETVKEFAKHFQSRPGPQEIHTDKGIIQREVPTHDVDMVEACNEEQLTAVYKGINSAIQLGAPLYNDGDHESCYGIYKQMAAHFEKDENMCKGVRDAFGVGLLKAETKKDPTAKAWAMRDTFDGLLQVIARSLQP